MTGIDFSAEKPKQNNHPSVADVQQLDWEGPGKSKSGGDLWRLCQFPITFVQETFLNYDPEELKQISVDIRGLRVYQVKGFKKDKPAGFEFHRVRKELFFPLEGRLEMTCEDVYGGKKIMTLEPGIGCYIPNFLLHCFKCKTNGSFLVIANTLFDPNDKRTHDTYSIAKFRELQAKYRQIYKK